MGILQRRILLVVAGLILATQSATVLTVLAQARADAEQRAHQQLELGCAVVRDYMRQRNHQLRITAEVLVSDFGFRRAVASGDIATVRSVLKNHATRVGANYAVLLSHAGEVLASTDDAVMHTKISNADWADLTQRTNDTLTLPVGRGTAYQMVAAPVRAPETIAWVAIGFIIDDGFAEAIKRIVGMEVSFANIDGDVVSTVARTLSVDTKDDEARYFRADDTLGSLGTELSLTLRVERAKALGAFYSLERTMLVLGLIALTIGVIAAVAMSTRLAKPILNLARVASAIRDGDYNVKVDLSDRDEIGDLARTIDSMQTEIKHREHRILEQASHDPLTGLPTRKLATENLQQLMDEPGAGVSVLIVACYGIQDVNSSYGLEVGEAVIRGVADRLSQLAGTEHHLARVADTRFLLMVPNQRPERAERLARTVINELSILTISEDLDVSLTASVGIASYPEHGGAPDELIRKAWDASMAESPTREPIAIYDAEVEATHARRLQITQSLRTARLEHQFSLVYQPKIAAFHQGTTGVEALLRWDHPELGFIPPDEFIPLAEGSGSITRITCWVLRHALGELADRESTAPHLTMAVNVSARDIIDVNFPALVTSLLHEHNVSAARLELEVTEGALLEDPPKAIATLNRLSELGVKIAIDDYGTGFSSLAQLKQLPVDTLKIDKSFVLNLDSSPEDALIVRSTIELAHSLNLSVVAEGVENAQSARQLIDWGCDMLQGYYYARPLSPGQLDEWLASTSLAGAPEFGAAKASS
jgi:diguanylate cyclase (GGDEF)-like protein